MRMTLVKIAATLHLLFMLIILSSPLVIAKNPNIAPVVFLIITATIVSWFFWPLCVISNIENWLRKKARLAPMKLNYISHYTQTFFGIRLPEFFIGSMVYAFSAFVWLFSLLLSISYF